MHAAAVEVLIGKSKFEPQVALGIAEAIDMVIQPAQFVTVPILDARLNAFEARFVAKLEGLKGELRVEMHAIKAELVRWVLLVMLGNVALTAGITATLNAFQR